RPARSSPRGAARPRAAGPPSSRPRRRARASGSPSRAPPQVDVDGARGELALAHRLDDGRAPVRRVPGGVDPRQRGPPGVRVDLDPTVRVDGEPVEPLRQLPAGLLSDRLDRGLAWHEVLAARNRLRPRAAALVRLAELHADALHGLEPVPADEAD